jgi:phenylacetate-CoA ligase
LRALQLTGLAGLIPAIERSEFQRERFRSAGLEPRDLRTFDALADVPPVRKSDLVAAGLDRLAAVPVGSRGVVGKATSGSTAEPFRFLLDRRSMDRGNAVRADIYEQLGAASGPAVELFDVPADRPGARGRPGHGTPGHDRRVIGYRLPVTEQVDLLTAIQPSVIYGNRSHLLLIADELVRRGAALPSLSVVVSSSETLTEADRTALTDALGPPVHDLYGLAEVEAVGWEPEPGRGYRVVSARVIVEVLRDGRPVGPGVTGEVVVTSIDNHVMPIVRYSSGDLATIPDRPDGAGRPPVAGPTLWLERIEGRRADCLVTSERALVSPWQASTSTFWGRAEVAAACRQWQIDQRRDLSVVVSVVPTDAGIPSQVSEQIIAFVREALGPVPVEVRVVAAVEHEPNGKFRAVRSAAG